MDEVYRGYRIAIKQAGNGWSARITHARGTLLPLAALATAREGPEQCLERGRAMVDRYLAFLAENGIGGKAN